MILKRLTIAVSEWGANKGRYTGEATFSAPLGEVKLNLSPEQISKIFGVCAEAIVAASKEVAILMTSQVLDSQEVMKQLEAID